MSKFSEIKTVKGLNESISFGTKKILFFKKNRIEATQEHYEYVRMDALIAERLTTSPRIYDIYTMCGLGIISEFFPHGDMEDLAIPGKHFFHCNVCIFSVSSLVSNFSPSTIY